MKKSVLACAACLVLIAVACIGWKSHVRATGELLTVTEINYQNSTITLTGNGDSVVYFSNSSAKKWEEAGTFENGKCVFDISWVSLSSNYVISFKGDKSDGVLKVTIPKQVTNFKVKYVPDNNEQPFTFTGVTTGRTIQWRKNGVGEWSYWAEGTTNTSLAYLKENGATLYFRLAPENGNSVSNTGKRASKEVSVKVSAKKAAPTVNVDASKFTIPLDNKMSYRVLTLDDNNNLVGEKEAAWTTVSNKKTYSLSELAPDVMLSGTDKTQAKPVALQIKNSATKTAQESRVTTIIIPAQGSIAKGTESKDGISMDYASSSSLYIEILANKADTPYEYCIIDKDNYVPNDLEYSRITWTAMSGTKVTLDSKTAKPGSHIFVRKKAVGKQGDEKFALASKELELTEATGVTYPAALTLSESKTFAVPAGYVKDADGRRLEFTATSQYANAEVTSIEFKDIHGRSYGTVSCTSTSKENENPTGSGDKYLITTQITSTANLDSKKEAWNKELRAYITLSNGDKIESTDEKGITLKLYPPTVVKNPTEAEKDKFGTYYQQYKTDFDRIYMSNDTGHDKTFKFILELGTQYKYNISDAASTGVPVTISNMAYGDVSLVVSSYEKAADKTIDATEEAEYGGKGEPDVMVCYEDTTNNAGEVVRKAYVTVHVNKFEQKVKELGTKLPFKITLNNGEILDSNISMTLAETATVPKTRTISFAQGGLKEKVIEKDKNGNIISEIFLDSYPIEVQLSDKLGKYIPTITDVKCNLNGQSFSISGGLDGEGNTFSIKLQNAKLNKLPQGSGEIMIEFSNGTTVKAGTISVTAPANK